MVVTLIWLLDTDSKTCQQCRVAPPRKLTDFAAAQRSMCSRGVNAHIVAFDSDPPLEMLVPFSDDRSYSKIAALAHLVGARDVVVASATTVPGENGQESRVVVATRIHTKRQVVVSVLDGKVAGSTRIKHQAADRLRAAIEADPED